MKTKILIIITFFISIFYLFLGNKLNAYCIHNKTDQIIHVVQSSGGKGWPFRFDETIFKGKTQCCNWKNRDCNTGGHKDSSVGFDVSYIVGGKMTLPICNNYKIKANGDLYIEGKNGHYKCRGGF